MKYRTPHNTKGFTVVETIMAITIFSMVLVALVSVSASSVTNVNFVRNRLTASYLGQEGIEIMRNVRDMYVFTSPGAVGFQAFVDSIDNLCMSSAGCTVEPIQTATLSQGGGVQMGFGSANGQSCYLRTNDTGYYTSNTGFMDRTLFCRKIFIEMVGGDISNGIKVRSVVSWQDGTAQREIEMTEYLYEWQ